MFEAKEHFVRTPPVVALALLLGVAGPIAARAELVTVPAAASSSLAEPPPPTVLRGSPPSAVRPIPFPVCPPGSVPAPDVGCVAPTGSDYAEGWPNYDYWPDWGYGYPFFGQRQDRFHRFPGFRGFHNPVNFGGFRIGAAHVGGFGRR